MPSPLPVWLLALATASGGDPIDAGFAPFLQDGCIDGPPVPAQPADARSQRDAPVSLLDMPMSARSLRFVITPDSYRGDGMLMVQIDSGLRRSLGGAGQPFVLATVGHWARSCTVRLSLDDCPQAKAVADQLQGLHIPVGYGFADPDTITLHAPSYTLQFTGEGRNTLTYRQPGNPLEQPLETARQALKACWLPAAEAAGLRPDE